jgi:hypothetical protein
MDERDERARTTCRNYYSRLAATVEASFDPDNTCRVNQNTEPSA